MRSNGIKDRKAKHKGRYYFVTFILTLVFIILLGRLTYLMIYKRNDLLAKRENQAILQQTIMPRRGAILDRNGNELAVSGDVYKVSLDLLELDNYITGKNNYNNKTKKTKADIAAEFSDIFGLDKSYVLDFFEKKNSYGDYFRGIDFVRKIEKDKIDQFKELKRKYRYNFAIVNTDTNRYYPNNNFLAQTLGFINDDGQGTYGLEKYYDKELTGVPGMKIAEVDAARQDLAYSDAMITEPINGKNLTLTIDENIQFVAENIAKKAMEDNKAKGISILVTNPRNGEVLAMVNKPDFNPNKPSEGNKSTEELLELWKNRTVNDAFEPGSTFKIVTTAAALEEGLTYRDDKFYDKGYVIVDGVRINCWKAGGHGAENLVDLLKNSCNPGFIELGKRLGKEKMNSYIAKFGFGKPVGIDLPGETSGIVKATDKISNVDLATMSFGQSNAASMVQIIGALNAIMNDGIYTTPHLMKNMSTVNSDGNSKIVDVFKEKNARQVVSKKTANELAEYLEEVVSKGSGKLAYIEGYGIAGKTGTAEKANIGGKGYSQGKYYASFVGAAPYNDPKVSIFIVIDEPGGPLHMGGEIVAPVAKDLFEQIFKIMSIQPINK